MNQEVHQEIEALRKQKTKALKARYQELFGEESRSSNHAHLFRRVAWRLQALSEGDLSQRARDRAADLASDVDLRLRPPCQFWSALADADTEERARRTRRDPRLSEAGTTLKRQYRGKTVCVKVLKDGFEYDGRQYESLSSIASSVTGTRWNGFSFFGLRKEAQSDRFREGVSACAAVRHLYTQVDRRRIGAGLQHTARAARGRRSIYSEPETSWLGGRGRALR